MNYVITSFCLQFLGRLTYRLNLLGTLGLLSYVVNCCFSFLCIDSIESFLQNLRVVILQHASTYICKYNFYVEGNTQTVTMTKSTENIITITIEE